MATQTVSPSDLPLWIPFRVRFARALAYHRALRFLVLSGVPRAQARLLAREIAGRVRFW